MALGDKQKEGGTGSEDHESPYYHRGQAHRNLPRTLLFLASTGLCRMPHLKLHRSPDHFLFQALPGAHIPEEEDSLGKIGKGKQIHWYNSELLVT